jgi:hypothetical protein
MKRLLVAIGFGLFFAVPAGAQQCLHGGNETAEERTRRREAVGAARAVNTIQANQSGRNQNRYLTHEELATSPVVAVQRGPGRAFNFAPGQEVVPGWELMLDVTPTGYWFMIKDKTDPCGFAYISNTNGLIYAAEPIR